MAVTENTNKTRGEGPAVTDVDPIRHSRRHDIDLCPQCGHPIASDGIAGIMRGKQRKIFELVRDAGTLGISRDAIAAVLYEGAANGGPMGNVISAQISGHINPKIGGFGLRIIGRLGPGGRYTLRKVSHET